MNHGVESREFVVFPSTMRNELAEPTIVHWHGQIIPPDMDGNPMDAIAQGETFDYSFDVINRAGTYWYHPHPHGQKRAAGLHGHGRHAP